MSIDARGARRRISTKSSREGSNSIVCGSDSLHFHSILVERDGQTACSDPDLGSDRSARESQDRHAAFALVKRSLAHSMLRAIESPCLT